MTRRGWWITGSVAIAAIISGGLWAYQSRTPETATFCNACDARHQHLANRLADKAKTASGALTPPSEGEPSE
jgi:hypothetical protein